MYIRLHFYLKENFLLGDCATLFFNCTSLGKIVFYYSVALSL